MEIRAGQVVGQLCGARDGSPRAGTSRRRCRPPRGRGLLRAAVRRPCGATADLRRPPWNGPDRRPRKLVQRRRRSRGTAQLRRGGHWRKAHLLIGHSAGAYYAQAMAAKRPALVVGLALVCPLLPGLRDVPEHRRIAGSGEIGDDVSRSYFVIQTPEMLERYLRYVAQPRSLSTRQRLIESVNTGSSAPFTPRLTRVQRWSWPDGSTPRLGMSLLQTSWTTTRMPCSQ